MRKLEVVASLCLVKELGRDALLTLRFLSLASVVFLWSEMPPCLSWEGEIGVEIIGHVLSRLPLVVFTQDVLIYLDLRRPVR